MRYLLIGLVFIVGVFVGRFSNQIPDESRVTNRPQDMGYSQAEKVAEDPQAQSSEGEIMIEKNNNKKIVVKKKKSPPKQIDSRFHRTEEKQKDKEVEALFSRLMQSRRQGDVNEQNRLFQELVDMSSNHQRTFQAKVVFLQDDEDWGGAYQTLKECAQAQPESIYCLQRLANIRSSSSKDKIKYAKACLEVERNNRLCLVDLATGLNRIEAFAEARHHFERVLNLPRSGAGFNRNYVLYHYGLTLERLGQRADADDAFAEACKLKNRAACQKLERL